MPLHVAGLRARHVCPRNLSLQQVIARVTTCQRGTCVEARLRSRSAPRPGWRLVGAAVVRAGPACRGRASAWRLAACTRRALSPRSRARGHDRCRGCMRTMVINSSWAYLWPVDRSVSLSAFPRCALAQDYRRRHNGKRETGWTRP
jgi:hypothetical protein